MIFASRPATLETRSRARSPRAIAVSSAARTWQFEFVSDSRRIPSLSSPSEPRSTASSWLVPQHRALSEKITPQPAKNRPRVKKRPEKRPARKKKAKRRTSGFSFLSNIAFHLPWSAPSLPTHRRSEAPCGRHRRSHAHRYQASYRANQICPFSHSAVERLRV